jgi:hypothetical protein
VLNTCTVAGIASGKTTIVTASNLIDCLTTPYFRALNTSVTAKQAELAFDMAMSWIEGNGRIEHLIQGVSLRPYPAITFANFSEYEFRNARQQRHSHHLSEQGPGTCGQRAQPIDRGLLRQALGDPPLDGCV